MTRAEIDKIEKALGKLCEEHDITISSGYALGQGIQFRRGDGEELEGAYEYSPRKIRDSLNSKKYRLYRK